VSCVATLIDIALKRIGDGRFDVLAADAVEPHLVPGMAAQPHALFRDELLEVRAQH